MAVPRWVWFVVPFGVVLVGTLSLLLVRGGTGPCDPVDTTFATLARRHQCVRLKGTAHYPSLLQQTEPATLAAPERTVYLFGFFPENDTAGRAIPVLVRTTRAPERLVTFETMTVEGWLLPVSRDRVPPNAEVLISKASGYFFEDDVVVLEATRVLSEDGVYEER